MAVPWKREGWVDVGCESETCSTSGAVDGIEAVVPKQRMTRRVAGQGVYPYLLRNLCIEWVGQVWSMDITYIPLRR